MINLGSHTLDLAALIPSRLGIVASSGAGKSWLVRRLLEQSHGDVQHLVIDPDGDYPSTHKKARAALAGHRTRRFRIGWSQA